MVKGNYFNIVTAAGGAAVSPVSGAPGAAPAPASAPAPAPAPAPAGASPTTTPPAAPAPATGTIDIPTLTANAQNGVQKLYQLLGHLSTFSLSRGDRKRLDQVQKLVVQLQQQLTQIPHVLAKRYFSLIKEAQPAPSLPGGMSPEQYIAWLQNQLLQVQNMQQQQNPVQQLQQMANTALYEISQVLAQIQAASQLPRYSAKQKDIQRFVRDAGKTVSTIRNTLMAGLY